MVPSPTAFVELNFQAGRRCEKSFEWFHINVGLFNSSRGESQAPTTRLLRRELFI